MSHYRAVCCGPAHFGKVTTRGVDFQLDAKCGAHCNCKLHNTPNPAVRRARSSQAKSGGLTKRGSARLVGLAIRRFPFSFAYMKVAHKRWTRVWRTYARRRTPMDTRGASEWRDEGSPRDTRSIEAIEVGPAGAYQAPGNNIIDGALCPAPSLLFAHETRDGDGKKVKQGNPRASPTHTSLKSAAAADPVSPSSPSPGNTSSSSLPSFSSSSCSGSQPAFWPGSARSPSCLPAARVDAIAARPLPRRAVP